MGRHQHHLRLPEHLYLSPPATPPPSNSFTSSFLSVRSAVIQNSSVSLLQETTVSAKAVGSRIPGFKTSAAFLTTLRANLNLDIDSYPPSLTNTPDSLRPINMTSSTGSLPPQLPLAQQDEPAEGQEKPPAQSNGPLDDVPPLNTITAKTEDDKIDALKMIADSVAQQRQYASRAVIFHPSIIAFLVLIVGLIYQFAYTIVKKNVALLGTTSIGLMMSILVWVRGLTGGYIAEAENVGTWKWLEKGRDEVDAIGEEDDIFITRYGQEPIGGLVLRGVRESTGGNSSPKKKRSSSNKNAPVTGQIRGFAVINRYRRRGVGTELLEEAIKMCREKGWQGPEFAADHANSARVLPSMFNGPFKKREKEAKKLLEKVKSEMGATGLGKKGRR